jgi:hypothetical protein
MLHQLTPKEKLEKVITESWELFIAKYLSGRIEVSKEAPFQHHFANIIQDIGELYCFSRTELFLVDLETKEEKLLKKNKYPVILNPPDFYFPFDPLY